MVNLLAAATTKAGCGVLDGRHGAAGQVDNDSMAHHHLLSFATVVASTGLANSTKWGVAGRCGRQSGQLSSQSGNAKAAKVTTGQG